MLNNVKFSYTNTIILVKYNEKYGVYDFRFKNNIVYNIINYKENNNITIPFEYLEFENNLIVKFDISKYLGVYMYTENINEFKILNREFNLRIYHKENLCNSMIA